MAKVKPIKPSQVSPAKEKTIPDGVFEAFNELIIKSFDGKKSTVKQKDVEKLVVEKTEITSKIIYENHWLDVEDHYKKAGWIVEFNKPCYRDDENFDAYFVFSKAVKK